jgi:hypothetical protein
MEGQQGQQQQPSAMMNSVLMAFNMGVAANQQSGGTKSVVEVVSELGEAIYANISRVYGTQYPDEFIRANVEFFLQIALLGYIIPGVCAYDEELKNRLFALIEAKLSRAQQPRPAGQTGGAGIINP